MMKRQTVLPFACVSIVFLLHLAPVTGQAPATAPTVSPSPTNITAILEKAGQFTIFIRLLKSTLVGDQLSSQLSDKKSNQGFTLFAPTDNAFSSLKSGTLNILSDQQKIQLVQFHVIPSVISLTQFQTVSNPLRTQAGSSDNGQFPLNVTTSGNQVNVTTGIVAARVDNAITSNSKLAIYQVDQVLLPLAMFGSPAPAPPPEIPKKEAAAPSHEPSGSDSSPVDASDAGANSFDSRALASFVVGATLGGVLLF
ncbi:fasciclin-like arabinogalactan protein 11 [Rhodamnia argentea]|uniref:Fasciclin-like arabinogalactan protein 11 n=1 Tax=Rhodamnia argentea TaxID=178133 RepID=A0A8B8NI20_9MYRT|nr:fasciclin-like arabinogalactan protein 11 [Rhodamnia argentea]